MRRDAIHEWIMSHMYNASRCKYMNGLCHTYTMRCSVNTKGCVVFFSEDAALFFDVYAHRELCICTYTMRRIVKI